LRQLALDYVSESNIHVAVSAGDAVNKAKEITPREGLICVTGSLYLVGEVKVALGELVE
jgi:hypothetical protein